MSQINVGFDNNSPQAIEKAYGKLVQGRTVPYASVAEAVTAVNINFRFRGKTVGIDDGTGLADYWWRVGTGDNQLVLKTQREQVIEFLVGDGGANTPLENATVYPGGTNTGTLINCKILDVGGDVGSLASITRAGLFQYYQYDPTSGLITLVNQSFNAPNWWRIKYRNL